jgi:hypothetical protein
MTPEVARSLAELGAWPLLILLVGLILVGALRRWWIPGWLYDQSRRDWETLRDQGDRNAKAIELMARYRDDDIRGGSG